ncbi:MAG: hypothetical protein K2P86_04190 [Xanthobacteraceae bacterium]|nr:hypothetical protein [Xanthobacteraceae bacterium]
MRTVAFIVAYSAIAGIGFSWIAAFIFYLRTHGSLSAEQSHLRGQLFFNWLFVNGKLTGEARDNARKVNLAMLVFFVCMFVAGGAFIVAVAPR